jgi:hypothetical protein
MLILKEESLKSFWKGHLTGKILSSTYILTQFSCFELLTQYTYKLAPITVENSNYKTLTHFVSGGIAA